MSLSRFLDYTGALDEDLEYLSNTGIEKIEDIVEASLQNGGIIIPGMGTVTSVNDILPNQTGNVNLSVNDITDVTIDNPPVFSQVLFYDNIGFNPPQWNNRLLTTSLINEPQGIQDPPNKYYLDSRVESYLKTILTQNYDILTRDDNNNLIKISKGTSNQLLSMNNNASAFEWKNISLNNLSGITITNPQITEVLKYNGVEFVNERVFLSDNVDVTVVSPNNGDALVYKDTGFENRALLIADITNLQQTLNNKVDKTTTYQNTGDIAYGGPQPNTTATLPISTPGKILKVSAQSVPEWSDPSTTLESLTNVSINNETYSDVLFYDNIGQNPPKWINKQLNTSLVPEINAQDPPNKYFTTQRVYDYLNVLLNDFDLLYNNNGNIEGLAKSNTVNTYLKSFANGVGYDTVKLNELLDHSSQVRVNFTIPANESVNMLEWIMQTSGIFDGMIVPSQNINPFHWGVRNDIDYGQWKIQNTSGNDIQIDRVNIDMAANFIIFNFVNSLIHNIMDDNLNDGTVRVRPNGINSDQIGGDGQIINSQVNDLGRFRTLTAGTSINITQDDNTITISATGITTTLAALTDVDLTTLANKEILVYNTTSNKWENKAFSTFNSQIDTEISSYLLTNVLTTNNSFLIRDTNGLLSQLAPGNNNTYLTINNTGSYIWSTIPTSITSLDSLTDVTINAATTGQVLYKSAGDWVNQSLTTSDVSEGSRLYYTDARVNTRLLSVLTTNEDILIRRGGVLARLPFTLNDNTLYLGSDGNQMVWKNVPTGATNLSQLQDCIIDNPPQNKNYLKYDAGFQAWINAQPEINDLSTFNILNPVNKDVIIFDTTPNQWVNRGLVLMDISDTDITATNLAGWLYFNSTLQKWTKEVISIGNVVSLQSELDAKIPKNTVTTSGDLIYATGNSTVTRLAIGTNGKVLYVSGGLPTWQSLGISDITNLSTSLANKVTNVFVDTGDLIVGNGANSYVKLAIGANNTYLKSDGTAVSWGTVPSYGNADVEAYLKTILTTDDDILYRNGTNLDRLAKPNTDNKYLKTVNGNLEYGSVTLNLSELSDAVITTPTNGQILSYNNANEWVNKSLAISDITNLQTTLDGKVAKADYTTKGRIIVATGAGTYQELAQPTALYQVLVSDITNALTPTGLIWAQLALNNNYYSNINITAPTNKQMLTYDTASTKWINSTFDGSFALPLSAPNSPAYWGPANIPYRVTNAAQSGLGSRAGGGVTVVYHNGIEGFAIDGVFLGVGSNTLRFALPTSGNSTNTTMQFGTSGAGIYPTGASAEVMNFGRSGTQFGSISNTSLYTATRLDIKNSKVEDYRFSINNIFNSYSFQNSTNTNEYIKIDTGTNDRVTFPRNAWGMVYYQDGNIINNLTLNNTLIKAGLGNTGTGVTVINSPNATVLTFNDGTGRIDFQRAGTYKIHVNMQMLQQDAINSLEIICFNANGGAVYPGGYKRASVNGNNYCEINMDFIAANVTLPASIDFYFRIPGGATRTFGITSYSIVAENLFTS